jgi:hypothetical protein
MLNCGLSGLFWGTFNFFKKNKMLHFTQQDVSDVVVLKVVHACTLQIIYCLQWFSRSLFSFEQRMCCNLECEKKKTPKTKICLVTCVMSLAGSGGEIYKSHFLVH